MLRVHNSQRRFQFGCFHRRAGKSVGFCNHVIRAALTNKRKFPVPRYAYIGPSFAQTKDLIWNYFKHYLQHMPNTKFSESDLQITLPNGAMINLYGGAAAYERMRGLYFDGVVLDEYPLLDPNAWPVVIRPTLADYKGWAIVGGTSNGDDHFHELKKMAEKNADIWDIHVVPVNETDALDPDELVEMTRDMSPEQYAREMLCSFDAPIEGAYYADLLNQAQEDGRVIRVPYDPAAPVITFWDLGIRDSMSIWFMQRVGREWHAIDYLENTGKGLDWYYGQLQIGHRAQWVYGGDIYPHDIRQRELSTAMTREAIAHSYGRNVHIAPNHKVEDGIQAVRAMIPTTWFDKDRCADGLACLRNYHSVKSASLGLTKPMHNWASHGSDAFRTGAMGSHLAVGWASTMRNALRRRRGRFTV